MEITEEIRNLAFDLIKPGEDGDPPEGFMQLLASAADLGETDTMMPVARWEDHAGDKGQARVGAGNCVFLELGDSTPGVSRSVEHQFDPQDCIKRGWDMIILGVIAQKRRDEGLDPQIGSVPNGQS